MSWFENGLSDECYKSENPLGYTSRAVHQACLDRYNKTFNTDEDPNISAETLHSEALLISLVNTRKGAPAYRGYFRLANHTGHGDDLTFSLVSIGALSSTALLKD
uniref:Uncharacterized protein n=1 Tax=Ditylenchus dipsaci TaxID=166011 RepID=A0A915EPG8_9BILA